MEWIQSFISLPICTKEELTLRPYLQVPFEGQIKQKTIRYWQQAQFV
jgi:hypothetical protein